MYQKNRVCGVIVSEFARRWGGNGFNSRPNPRHSQMLYLPLLYQRRTIDSMSRENALAQNSVPSTLPDEGRAIKKLVV